MICENIRFILFLFFSSDESEVKGYNDGIDLAISVIAEFPSVESERKKGRWIDGMLYYDFDESEWEKVKCSVCKNFVVKQIFYHDFVEICHKHMLRLQVWVVGLTG